MDSNKIVPKSLPIYEPGLLDVVKECRNRNLFFSSDLKETIQKAQVIFVAVNTPTKESGFGVCLIRIIPRQYLPNQFINRVDHHLI